MERIRYNLTPEQVQELVEMRKSGMTLRAIEEKTGIGDNAINRALSRAGYVHKKPERKYDIIFDLLKEGKLSNEKIAKKAGTTIDYVNQLANKYKREQKKLAIVLEAPKPTYIKVSNFPSDNVKIAIQSVRNMGYCVDVDEKREAIYLDGKLSNVATIMQMAQPAKAHRQAVIYSHDAFRMGVRNV